MALPPVTAVAEDAPLPAGNEPVAAPMVEGEEGASSWQPVATIMRNGETGEFKLVDDPADADGEGPAFDSPQALMRGVMERLNNSEAAEASFGKAFRGEEDAAPASPAAKPMAKPPMAAA